MWNRTRTQEVLFPIYPSPFKPPLLSSHSYLPINVNRWRNVDHTDYADKERTEDMSPENIPKKSKNLTNSRLR